jgi:hypothetical protein
MIRKSAKEHHLTIFAKLFTERIVVTWMLIRGYSNVVKETGYEEWSSPRPFLEYDIVVRVPYLVEEAGGKLATPI